MVKSDLSILAIIFKFQLTGRRKGKRKTRVCLRTFPRNCICPFCVRLTSALSLIARNLGNAASLPEDDLAELGVGVVPIVGEEEEIDTGSS